LTSRSDGVSGTSVVCNSVTFVRSCAPVGEFGVVDLGGSDCAGVGVGVGQTDGAVTTVTVSRVSRCSVVAISRVSRCSVVTVSRISRVSVVISVGRIVRSITWAVVNSVGRGVRRVSVSWVSVTGRSITWAVVVNSVGRNVVGSIGWGVRSVSVSGVSVDRGVSRSGSREIAGRSRWGVSVVSCRRNVVVSGRRNVVVSGRRNVVVSVSWGVRRNVVSVVVGRSERSGRRKRRNTAGVDSRIEHESVLLDGSFRNGGKADTSGGWYGGLLGVQTDNVRAN